MRLEISLRIGVMAALAAGTALAQESLTLTGVARDFAELKEGDATGGHPDFNPNMDPATGLESWACFDKPTAGKGAVQTQTVLGDANPDKLPGLIPYDRDEIGPALKPDYATPPNCFRSRFGDWYTTRTPDINRAFFLDLTFTKEGSVYKYDNSAFFPLDNDKSAALKPQVPSVTATFGHRQTGNMDGIDMATHNFGFTFELHAKFAYAKGAGQRFDFRGDDDVWVFINDSLVIDLGGVHSAEYAAIDLDGLGLVDGKNYPLDFYFAERRVTGSRLTITTSLDLKPVVPLPDSQVPSASVKAVEGWLYDRDGDGIADKAEVAFDKQPDHTPTAFELDLLGEAATGNWDIARDQGKVTLSSKAQFFTKPATSWDESDPANLGKVSGEPATGLAAGTFPLHDRIGAVIEGAWKLFLDTALSQVPKEQIRIRFTEPVSVASPAVLKFQDPSGADRRVLLSEAIPDSSAGGRSLSWTFTIASGSPNVPGEKWKVAIDAVALVKDEAGNPVHPANPWRRLEAKLPAIVIGDLRVEKGGVMGPAPDPSQVRNPFFVLTSPQALEDRKDYVPLDPMKADAIFSNYNDANPGLAIFTFKMSHPARLNLTIYDNLGQFVNRAKVEITRDDLQSGKLARDPVTRAFLLRLAWFPVSHDGNRISTGVYILRAVFEYGLDPRDYVERGSQMQLARFGFLRDWGLRGISQP